MATRDDEHRDSTLPLGEGADLFDDDDEEDFDPAEYDTLLQLERLESLEEEMTELGVASLADIRRRIEELNTQLDNEQGQRGQG